MAKNTSRAPAATKPAPGAKAAGNQTPDDVSSNAAGASTGAEVATGAGAPAGDTAASTPATPEVEATPPPKPGKKQADTAMFEVLTPFKFNGYPVKPPAWIELSDDEAAPYQAAGVLGTEPGEAPSAE